MRCRMCVPALVLLITLCISVLMYWWLFDYSRWNPLGGPAVVYYDEYAGEPPLRVRNHEAVLTRWRYQVLRDCPRQVSLFVGGIPIWTHPGSTRGDGAMTEPRSGTREITIPSRVQLPPGKYAIRSVAVSQCNGLREDTAVGVIPIEVVE